MNLVNGFLLHNHIVEHDEPRQVELCIERLYTLPQFDLDHLVEFLVRRLLSPCLAFRTVGIPHLLNELVRVRVGLLLGEHESTQLILLESAFSGSAWSPQCIRSSFCSISMKFLLENITEIQEPGWRRVALVQVSQAGNFSEESTVSLFVLAVELDHLRDVDVGI